MNPTPPSHPELGQRPDPARPSGATGQPDAVDPQAVIADLRRQLRRERERALNATDRVLGAQAEAAQARAEIKELHHLVHVREVELAQLRELVETGGQGARNAALPGAVSGALSAAVAAARPVARDGLDRLARRAGRR